MCVGRRWQRLWFTSLLLWAQKDGYCGGLTANLKYGEVLIVQSAMSEDGVSDQYFPDQSEFFSSPALVAEAQKILNAEKFPYQPGKIITTSAMFLETERAVQAWSDKGFIGVDGETATTLAVASKFGAECISLLTCSDNLALGDNYYEVDSKREVAEASAFEKIQNLALRLA